MTEQLEEKGAPRPSDRDMSNGPPGMRDEIVAYKRERILQEAVTLFYERGFTGTTLDDIAQELGVTKPFIYTHFKSKTDLLAAICLPTIQMSVEAALGAVASPGTPTQRLEKFIIDFTKVILIRQPNIAVYFREEKSLEPAALEEITSLRKRFGRIVSGLLTEGVEAGEFQISDPGLASLALGGMISWMYTWHRPGGRLGVEALSTQMAEFALRMAGVSRTVTAEALEESARQAPA